MFARFLNPVGLALATASLIVACGGGGGGSSATNPTTDTASPSSPITPSPGGTTPAATPQATLSGSVVKGPAAHATVRIYALDASGKRGALLAEVKTGADGGYSATIAASASGYLIEADLEGAEIQDEVSGGIIKGQAGEVLSAVIVAPSVSGTSASPAPITTHVTPFSSMATEMARKLGGGDLRPADVANANDKVQQWSGSNFLTTAPQTQMQTQLRAISQLVRDDGSLSKALQTLSTAVKSNADGSVSIDGAFSLKLLDACKQSGASGCDTDTHFGDREMAEKPLSKSPTDLPASPSTPAASAPQPAASTPTPAASAPQGTASSPTPAASKPSSGGTSGGGTSGGGTSGGGTTVGGGAPTPSVVALDALGGSLTSPASFDASLGSHSLSDDASRASVTRISGFGADDSLHLLGTSAAALSVSSQGRDVRLVVNQGGVVSSLTLVDVIPAGALVYDVPSFNALPVGDVSFQ